MIEAPHQKSRSILHTIIDFQTGFSHQRESGHKAANSLMSFCNSGGKRRGRLQSANQDIKSIAVIQNTSNIVKGSLSARKECSVSGQVTTKQEYDYYWRDYFNSKVRCPKCLNEVILFE